MNPLGRYIGHPDIRKKAKQQAIRQFNRENAEPTDGDVRRIVEAERKRALKAEKLKKQIKS